MLFLGQLLHDPLNVVGLVDGHYVDRHGRSPGPPRIESDDRDLTPFCRMLDTNASSSFTPSRIFISKIGVFGPTCSMVPGVAVLVVSVMVLSLSFCRLEGA
ncbi:MAG: hypothetical protein J0J05_11255 [Microbacterium sp.]|uniref:hypothetical protein n=1 Tax=Microbacterium sp. TaxID=51671 RepID=UPI001AC2DC50|nr:hypothetical protein [Microbacterium sp.]MBN9154550.1 hypothetical protein [Microbacterium sp.]